MIEDKDQMIDPDYLDSLAHSDDQILRTGGIVRAARNIKSLQAVVASYRKTIDIQEKRIELGQDREIELEAENKRLRKKAQAAPSEIST